MLWERGGRRDDILVGIPIRVTIDRSDLSVESVALDVGPLRETSGGLTPGFR